MQPRSANTHSPGVSGGDSSPKIYVLKVASLANTAVFGYRVRDRHALGGTGSQGLGSMSIHILRGSRYLTIKELGLKGHDNYGFWGLSIWTLWDNRWRDLLRLLLKVWSCPQYTLRTLLLKACSMFARQFLH